LHKLIYVNKWYNKDDAIINKPFCYCQEGVTNVEQNRIGIVWSRYNHDNSRFTLFLGYSTNEPLKSPLYLGLIVSILFLPKVNRKEG